MEPGAHPRRHPGRRHARQQPPKAKRSTDSVGGPSCKIEVNDDSIETRDRVAGLMVLLYGQYPARTCRLTTAHVIHDENGVALRLNRTPLRLPPPLDGLVLQLVDIANDHQHTVMSNDLNAPWLFPTQRPGKALGSKQLSRRLRKIGLNRPGFGRDLRLLL
ncbi:hypothetical protein [Streptomyces rubiginosohelvolus]|uniref:hypothetical protein n=1 Tax=Streptomyces rubiginosohelvolus TaxID=67362 RepID=UPI0035D77731